MFCLADHEEFNGAQWRRSLSTETGRAVALGERCGAAPGGATRSAGGVIRVQTEERAVATADDVIAIVGGAVRAERKQIVGLRVQ